MAHYHRLHCNFPFSANTAIHTLILTGATIWLSCVGSWSSLHLCSLPHYQILKQSCIHVASIWFKLDCTQLAQSAFCFDDTKVGAKSKAFNNVQVLLYWFFYATKYVIHCALCTREFHEAFSNWLFLIVFHTHTYKTHEGNITKKHWKPMMAYLKTTLKKYTEHTI